MSDRRHSTVAISGWLWVILTLATSFATVLGVMWGSALLVGIQYGESGQAGLQRLLDRVATCEFIPADELVDPSQLEHVTDDKGSLMYVFVGPQVIRKSLNLVTAFEVEGIVGDSVRGNGGMYWVRQTSTFTLGDVDHKVESRWKMSVKRTDGRWLIEWAGVYRVDTSLPANPLPGLEPALQKDIGQQCSMGRMVMWNTFTVYGPRENRPACLLPSGVDSPLIDPAIRDLIGGKVEGVGVSYDDAVDVMWNTSIAPFGSDTVSLSVFEFTHDGQSYFAAFLPTADGTARLAAVVKR